MNKDEIMLQKRLIELSRTAYQRGIYTYSDFLNINELHILHTTPKNDLYTNYETFGGYESSERQMVSFIPDALYCEKDYPVSILNIKPLQRKFADKLSHRDYLGTILGLGIERSKIGDILVLEEEAFAFIHSSLETFLLNELSRIKHTSVIAAVIKYKDFHFEPSYEEITGTVSSVRLDSLLATAYKESRSKLVGLIEGGKVYINGKIITTNSFQVRDEDIISVRGYGKFRYKGILSQTKKGRYCICLQKYI